MKKLICPGCGVDARRPKCFWEMGGDCPRHEVLWKWRAAQRKARETRAANRVAKAAEVSRQLLKKTWKSDVARLLDQPESWFKTPAKPAKRSKRKPGRPRQRDKRVLMQVHVRPSTRQTLRKLAGGPLKVGRWIDNAVALAKTEGWKGL